MRLLPVRPDHGRRRAPQQEQEPERRRHRPGDDEHLPLWHLPAYPRGDPHRREDESLTRRGADMTTTTKRVTNLSRRKFIITSAGAAGGLAVGMQLPFLKAAQAQTGPALAAGSTEVNHWIVIKPD